MTIQIKDSKQIENLTKEDILKIADQKYTQTFDTARYKELHREMNELETKFAELGQQFSLKCEEVGLKPADRYADDDDEDVQEEQFSLHSQLDDLAYLIGMRYGLDYDYGGGEHDFWTPSNC